MLTLFTTVITHLEIFALIYEVASAVITSVRSVQTLNRGGQWRMQQRSLTFLILREGARYYLLDSLRVGVLIPQLLGGRPNIFWVGFKLAPLRDT